MVSELSEHLGVPYELDEVAAAVIGLLTCCCDWAVEHLMCVWAVVTLLSHLILGKLL